VDASLPPGDCRRYGVIGSGLGDLYGLLLHLPPEGAVERVPAGLQIAVGELSNRRGDAQSDGGAADLSLRPSTICADGLTLPDVVNLVHYDDREACQRFNADPDFQPIEYLRAGSVDLMTFDGYLSAVAPSPVGLPDTVYSVEVVTDRDGTGEAYRAYEQRGAARMREFGYRVGYVLAGVDPKSACSPSFTMAVTIAFCGSRSELFGAPGDESGRGDGGEVAQAPGDVEAVAHGEPPDRIGRREAAWRTYSPRPGSRLRSEGAG
jgi:hypothetical protein